MSAFRWEENDFEGVFVWGVRSCCVFLEPEVMDKVHHLWFSMRDGETPVT